MLTASRPQKTIPENFPCQPRSNAFAVQANEVMANLIKPTSHSDCRLSHCRHGPMPRHIRSRPPPNPPSSSGPCLHRDLQSNLNHTEAPSEARTHRKLQTKPHRGSSFAASRKHVTKPHRTTFLPASAHPATRRFFPKAFAALALATLIGCGNTYRPVVTAINPVGPAAQPQSMPPPSQPPARRPPDSSPSSISPATPSSSLPTSAQIRSILMSMQPEVRAIPSMEMEPSPPSTSPTNYLAARFSKPPFSTGATATSLFPQGTYTYVTEPGRNAVAQLSGTPPALKQELSVGSNVVYVVGYNAAQRLYALSQGSAGSIGQASAIDVASNTVTTNVPVGVTPVYGVMTADFKRAYIMNKGSNTVSVINAQTNALDTFTGSTGTGTIAVGTAPVWADLAPTKSELVVANAGNGATSGSVSIISIPLCNAASVVSNVNCDPVNPVDAAGFGTVLANVPVGVNPVVIAVLADGTRAYVANGGNPNLPCATVPVAGVSTGCTVSVVNLTTNTVTATIPISGHPGFLAVSNATPTGKVYVTSKDNSTMTIIRTDTDSVVTTVDLQGKGVMVPRNPALAKNPQLILSSSQSRGLLCRCVARAFDLYSPTELYLTTLPPSYLSSPSKSQPMRYEQLCEDVTKPSLQMEMKENRRPRPATTGALGTLT